MEYIRENREALKLQDSRFSVCQVATRIDVRPAYLSKTERGEVAPPSEAKFRTLADKPNENTDVLLAMAGKVIEKGKCINDPFQPKIVKIISKGNVVRDGEF